MRQEQLLQTISRALAATLSGNGVVVKSINTFILLPPQI